MSPGRHDRALVQRHLIALDQALTNLRKHQGERRQALDDPDEAWIVERGLQLCAQNLLDISTHLAAAHGRDAADYASAIDQLASLGILPAEFAKRIRAVAGFRNILVHGYLAVDLDRLHDLLNHRLDDFVEFAGHVGTYMEGDTAD
jgi:uncharacterized protein YutE (UPF0331/DUF86 family)